MAANTSSPTAQPALYEWANRYRQPVSFLVAFCCLAALLTTEHSWPRISVIDVLVETLGFLLIGIAAFGRTWCSLYISGYKADRIVCEGPYSIVRNPLYVFSFIGAMGIGLASENLLVLALLLSAFLLYYPLVVFAEEGHLQAKFGQPYIEYMHNVPRFVPRHLRPVEPDIYPVRPRHFRKALPDVLWFFWFFMILQLVERMHQAGWLPVWFRIP